MMNEVELGQVHNCEAKSLLRILRYIMRADEAESIIERAVFIMERFDETSVGRNELVKRANDITNHRTGTTE